MDANNLDSIYGDGNDATNSLHNGSRILKLSTFNFAAAGKHRP